MKYDKKRITSTVILGVFLVLTIIMTLPFLPMTLKSLQEAGDSAGAAIGAVFGALFMIIFVFFVFGLAIISCSICLPFAIANRKSTLKAVRIISYIYDALFGIGIVLSIVKIITFIYM